MADIKSIRQRLRLTQQALAEGIGCVQGNISFYENGKKVPPPVAERLIAFAKSHGLMLTYDHVYGGAALPDPEDSKKAGD